MNPKLLISLVVLLTAWNLGAQKTKSKNDEPTKNIDRFLDDGKAKNSNNLLRLRLSTSLSGYIGASYERKFSKRFGLEGGLYTKIGNKGYFENIRLIDMSIGISDDPLKIRGGAGVLLFPKYYYSGNYINNVYYIGLRTTFHTYNTESQFISSVQPGVINTSIQKVRSTYSSYSLLYGMHTNIASNITLGTETGFIFYQDKFKDIKYGEIDPVSGDLKITTRNKSSIGLLFFGDIVIGYLF